MPSGEEESSGAGGFSFPYAQTLSCQAQDKNSSNIQSPSQSLCEGLRYLGLRIFAEFMDLFVSTLEQAAEMYENASDFLPMLGTAYVKFFYHNPVYFDFLFPEHEHVPIYKFTLNEQI